MDKSVAESQADRFKEAAKMLDCDPDEARWSERLKKVAKRKSGASTQAP